MSRYNRVLSGLCMAAALVIAPTIPALPISAPDASAGPCSEMFGNFGSLLNAQTEAGMMAGSAELDGALGSAGSSTASLGSLFNPLGSLALTRDSEIIRQLETGSVGNSVSGSLDAGLGSVLGFPQWTTGEQGTVPVLNGPTRIKQLLTGPTSPLDTPAKYGIGGTDLGLMWDNGDQANHQVLMAFGDTMGDCDIPGNQWRGNVMFRTSDPDLSDGLSVDSVLTDDDGLAKEMVPRTGAPGEVTIIPTAGISVDGVQYLRFMSVHDWGVPSTWDTNYSGLAYSTDNGETWTVDSSLARPITDHVSAGESAPAKDDSWFNAQMSSFVDGRDGYIYEYLTPSGRSGSARLARVAKKDIRNAGAYRYWDGSSWTMDIDRAKAVLPSPVSELSVQWHPGLQRYVSMYSSGTRSVIIRTAPSPEGPWSRATTLIDYSVLPGAYGGFIHPWSTGNDLYFVVTTWDSYNVFLAHTDLSKINLPGVQQRNVPDSTAVGEGPVNTVSPSDATNTDAPAIELEETGTTVERTVTVEEVVDNGGIVPEE